MKFTSVALLALAAPVAAQGNDKMAAVSKVISMLKEMQSKTVNEGEAEAATYNEFACFCKDTTKAKSEAIEAGVTERGNLNADLETYTSDRDTADEKIGELTETIKTLTKEMKDAVAERKKTKSVYDVEILDISGAIQALESALETLKASDVGGRAPALLQLKDTISTAVMMAQALNLKHSTALMQMTQPEVEMENYKFHSNDIISMLEGLLKDFKETETKTNEAEVASVQEHNSLMQTKTDEMAAAEKSLAEEQQAKADATANIGETSKQLSTVVATLNDDQNYLKDLTAKCNSKKDMWDQRSGMRQEEVSTLTTVIHILETTVSESNTGKTVRLMQEAAEFVQVRQHKTENPLRMLAVRQRVHQHAKAKSFLAARSPRDQLLNLLNAKAMTLKSAVLASVAAHAKADPLAKVKTLIEQLILRLQQEASDEASHHQWCTKSMTEASDARQLAADKSKKLNAELAQAEATRDKLEESIKTLTDEIKALEDALEEATTIREAESKENAETVSTAKTGLEAVSKALKIVDEFYKTAAKKDVEATANRGGAIDTALEQQPVADDLPDAGFDEEYGAQGDAATGVLGMLEVITSDFERTISTTEANEKKAQAEYDEFKTTTNMSLEEKNTAKTADEGHLNETNEKIDTDNESLTSQMLIVTTKISELMELHGACVDTGMSYEERVARRKDEIESLKSAYSILDNYRS